MSVVQLLRAASRECALIKTKLQIAQDEMDNFAPKSCFCGGMQQVAGDSDAALLPLPTGGHGPASLAEGPQCAAGAPPCGARAGSRGS